MHRKYSYTLNAVVKSSKTDLSSTVITPTHIDKLVVTRQAKPVRVAQLY